MKTPGRFHRPQKRSWVLVLTLLILVLISVIVIGMLSSVTVERQITEANFQQRRALAVAVLGAQSGVAQLRYALGTGTNSWDNPYANFAVNPPTFFWSVSPGMLTRWSYTQAATPAPQTFLNPSNTNIALFSQTSDPLNTSLVNLNRPLEDGSYPIIGGTSPPNVSVQFVNVLQNPSLAASASNPIIGRYAFWIDDENAKININVADGTQKYTTNSLGLGSPTEVSLGVLQQGGTNLSPAGAQSIVQMARTNSFHSPHEILRVAGTTPDLYTNNVFNVTDYSRSPDLNVFGQPKMALMPVVGAPFEEATNMDINGINFQPVSEIYPTPNQLPPYNIMDPVAAYGGPYADAWPLALRGQGAFGNMGSFNGFSDISYAGRDANFIYNNGLLLANYLAGTNAAGNPVLWPTFAGSATTGFAGKYSGRQLDEIVIQMLDLGSKLTCSDYAHALSTDYPTDPMLDPVADWKAQLYGYGYRFMITPTMFPGWLSKQWVIGMGRAPKVTRLAMSLTNLPPLGNPASLYPAYTPPSLYLSVHVEEWIPGAYRGGFPVTNPSGEFAFTIGQPANIANLNVTDGEPSVVPVTPAVFPKPVPDASGSTNNYWQNQLLTNNQGIDVGGNVQGAKDPDQLLAAQYHPYMWDTTTSVYDGAFGQIQSDLDMNWLQLATDAQEWGVNTVHPGQMRCVQNGFYYEPLYMQTNAGTVGHETLTLSGGISVHHCLNTQVCSDSDPVPLEAARGGTSTSWPLFTGDWSVDVVPGTWTPVYSWNITNGMTGSPPGTTLWQRHLASVIPVNVSLTVPTSGFTGYSTNIYMYAQDPLVNKFPGDWIQSGDGAVALPPVGAPLSGAGAYYYYSELGYLASMKAAGGDPDSFWVPQEDTIGYTKAEIAADTIIPRSARMPSIGYLQYIRTGVIPDDETASYQTQHGTPFRLLSYGPCNNAPTDTSQTVHNINYPDWALLDLVYVPSILNSYGGPYASYTNLAAFGTYGGATAGRINPNGTVIYTTNINLPQPNVTRTLPLQATLYGLMVNQTNSANVSTPAVWGYSGGAALDSTPASTLAGATVGSTTSASLAQAIASYISTYGPLRMPGEICNIPQVAALRASENVLGTRNDLVRQMIGELTTQSNVFSVWTVGQVVRKAPSNNVNWGEFESGDQVQGEVRLHFIVERYLDPGADGIYGNSKKPGPDGYIGSFDDPVDANHPFEPTYLYHVVRAEEIR